MILLCVQGLGAAHLASGIFSEGIVALVAAVSVSLWAKVRSGASSVITMNQIGFALKKKNLIFLKS